MTHGYREEKGGTFESNGVKHDLNYIFAHTEHEPVEYIEVRKLVWVLDENSPYDPHRVKAADLTAPLLVVHWQGKELVVDGIHRLIKAVQEKVKTLPYRRVSDRVMRESVVKPHWTYW